MPSITFSKQIESDTLHMPELLPFVGHRVEIVVHDSEAPAELADARLLVGQANEGVCAALECNRSEPVSRPQPVRMWSTLAR